jgi:hypothetical protein
VRSFRFDDEFCEQRQRFDRPINGTNTRQKKSPRSA